MSALRSRTVAPGLMVWLFIFVAFAGTTLIQPYPTLRLAAALVYGLPVVLWAVFRARGPFNSIDLAILVGVGAHLVVSVLSLDRVGSLEASGVVVGYASVYWLARRLGSEPRLRRVMVVAIVVALLFWLVILSVTWVVEKAVDVQVLGWPPRIEAHQAYAWGSVNTPPILVLLAVPFVAWQPSVAVRRTTAALLLAIAAVIIPFSVGRAAWLGMAVALLSLEPLFGWPISRGLRRAAGHPALPSWGVILAVAVVGTTVIGLAGGRWSSVVAALESRVLLWHQAFGLFAADPLTGSGPSTYAWARLVHVPDYSERVGVGSAHSVPIQAFADGGLLLGVALIALVAVWMRSVYVGRTTLDTGGRLAVAAVLGFGAFSLFDDLSFLPAVTVLVTILAAWSLPLGPDGPDGLAAARRLPAANRFGVSAVLAAGLVLTIPTVATLGLMRLDLGESRAAALEGRWTEALAGFRRAAETQPANALHWMSLGLAEHRAGHADAASQAYEAARRANLGDPRPWGALAALAATLDQRIEMLAEASRRSADPQYAFRLGSALLDAGDVSAAVEAFAIASVIQPAVYGAVPAALREEVRTALPRARDRAGSLAPGQPREAEWNAALAADEIDPSAPVQWTIARHVDAGDRGAASSELERALAVEPRERRTHQAAAMVARLTCDRPGWERADASLKLLGPDGVARRTLMERRGLYGELELGDYQPLDESPLPETPPWPVGLIDVRDCGW